MPVLGHAFVGLATAVTIRPNRSARGVSFWLPTVVALAYLPDIVSRGLLLAGVPFSRSISHSMLLAPAAAACVAAGLMPLRWLSFLKLFALALFSIVVHQILDLLTATDRMLLWPLIRKPVGEDIVLFPDGMGLVRECLLFGSAFLVFLAMRWIWLRGLRGERLHSASAKAPGAFSSPAGWVGVGAILLLAAGVHGVCEFREHQLEQARRLLADKQFGEALVALDRAAGWPHLIKPGRIEYAQAVAFQGLGDVHRAETLYLQSYRLDPWYFWCVEDLALLYALSPAPLDERRRKAEPWMDHLDRDFAAFPQTPFALARLRAVLQLPPTSAPLEHP